MVASQDASSVVVGAQGPSGARTASRAKLLIAGLIVLALLGVLGASLLREARTADRATAGAVPRPSLAPPRPALTAAEEAYAQALWAIHGDVKNAAYNLTFSGLNYKLKQADGSELAARVHAASTTLGQAEGRVLTLVPPPSLRQVHDQYLDAVHLFQRSAAEMLKVATDGRDDHLLAAHPLSQEASEKLLRVGNAIWPGEYLPN